jgi:hypothetical protein
MLAITAAPRRAIPVWLRMHAATPFSSPSVSETWASLHDGTELDVDVVVPTTVDTIANVTHFSIKLTMKRDRLTTKSPYL